MTTKTAEELAKLLVETRAELRATRFTAAGARAKDSSSLKKLRATVARIMTAQRLHAHKTI
jgi:ribosomal protein L29